VDYSGFLAQAATAADCSRGNPPPVAVPTTSALGTGAMMMSILAMALLRLRSVHAAARARARN